MVRSPWDCRKITALYQCDFMGTARAPCGNLATAARGPYDYPRSLPSSYVFFAQILHCPHDQRAASVRCPCGHRAMLPTTCLRACDFLKCVIARSYNSLFVLKFYGPVNPMESCRARSVYLTTRLLDRLSPLSG